MLDTFKKKKDNKNNLQINHALGCIGMESRPASTQGSVEETSRRARKSSDHTNLDIVVN